MTTTIPAHTDVKRHRVVIEFDSTLSGAIARTDALRNAIRTSDALPYYESVSVSEPVEAPLITPPAPRVVAWEVHGCVSEAAYEWETWETDKATAGAEPGTPDVLIVRVETSEYDDSPSVGHTYNTIDLGEARHPLHLKDDGMWWTISHGADHDGPIPAELRGKWFTDVWVTPVIG